MTEQEFTDYMHGDAMLDLLLFSTYVDDLLADFDAGRLTLAMLREDADAADRLADIRRQGSRLMAALAFLAPTTEQEADA